MHTEWPEKLEERENVLWSIINDIHGKHDLDHFSEAVHEASIVPYGTKHLSPFKHCSIDNHGHNGSRTLCFSS